MHTYKVFEVIEGQEDWRNTGKIVRCPEPMNVINKYCGNAECINQKNILDPLFNVYGFTGTYTTYYQVRTVSTKDLIRICYNYGALAPIKGLDGFNDTWVLVRGV